MKAFLFSDLHTNYKQLKNAENFLKENDISLILFAGDFVNMGEPVEFAYYFSDTVKSWNKPFFWVPGNNDFGRGYFKVKASFPTLEGKIMEFYGHKFTGVGGSPESWAGQYQGETIDQKIEIGNTIFLSHVPPPGVRNYQRQDCQSPTSNRKFKDSPLVHICGHIHYQWGCTYLGQTKLIKLGALDSGFYAILDLDTLEVEFKRFR